MRWDQIDSEARVVHLWKGTTKNKEGRDAPIYTDELQAMLVEQKRLRDTECPGMEYVFFDDENNSEFAFSKSWKSACKRAGQEGLLFHDLRRTAIRNMIRAGIGEPLAMKISGHKTPSTFRRYNILDDNDLHEAGKKLATFHEEARVRQERLKAEGRG